MPDILAPYKHYHLDIIMGMLDGTLTTDDLEYETYPCEKTVERWKAWLEQNRTDMDGYMKSVGYRLLGYGEELPARKDEVFRRQLAGDHSADDLQLRRTITPPFPSAGLAPLHRLCFAVKF